MCVYICIDFSCICVRIYIEMGSVNPRKAYDKYALVSEAALTQSVKNISPYVMNFVFKLICRNHHIYSNPLFFCFFPQVRVRSEPGRCPAG